jgi:hypothetical protein
MSIIRSEPSLLHALRITTMKRLNRSIENPIREDLKWDEKWKGPDSGLIWSWERGRQKRVEDPDLAEKAEKGELVILPWKGGVEKNTTNKKKYGSLKYLWKREGSSLDT